MEFKSAFFAIVVVGILITAVTVVINGWGVGYGSDVTSDLMEYDKSSDLEQYTGDYQGRITPTSPETSSDVETQTYRGVYGIISNPFSPLRLVFGSGGMIDSISQRFHIPSYIWRSIVSLMIISIIFTIVAIIFRINRGAA